MKNPLKDQIIIDGLQYCNWNRALFEDVWKGGITAISRNIGCSCNYYPINRIAESQ